MRLSGLEKTCLVIILVIVLLMVQPFGPSVYAGPEHLEEPVQVSLRVPDVRILETKDGPVTLQLVAEYRVEAGVRSRRNYQFDATADVSPMDLVLAWGSLNQEEALDSVSYRQSGRWYYYRAEEDSPVSLSYVGKNSANTHIIPAGRGVERKLKKIRKNDY
ncbi:MAG: hypothetical protein SCK57_14585, partial [Bacillota bacterium]|nr:hypothetical protein [Bacillota bacterium]